jgi:hypothetical protein
MTEFERELTDLINRHSVENASNTPDFILACFMAESLTAFNKAVHERARWYGRMDKPGQYSEGKSEYESFDDKY